MIQYPHMIDDFMENYRLLHVTWNNPPLFGLTRTTTIDMSEWYCCVVGKKLMGSGKLP